MELMNLSCEGFLEELASKAAAPGGGGASALGGAQPQSYGKNRAKTLDVLLSKYTKVIGAAFLVVTFLVWILSIYF